MKSKTIRLFARHPAKILLKGAVSGLVPLLLTSAQLFGGLSPFSAAFTGAVRFSGCIPAALGAFFGILLFQPSHLPLRITALFLLLALRFLLNRVLPKKQGALLRGGCVLGAGAVSLGFYTLLARLGTYSLVCLILELVLSFGVCVIFSHGLDALEKERADEPFADGEKIGLCAVFAALLISLSAFPILSLNPAVVLCCPVILLAASAFGAPGASLSGMLAALALCLASNEAFTFAAALAVGAFFAGAFRGAGRFAPMIALLCTAVFTLFLLGVPVQFAYDTAALFLGSGIYILLPARAEQLLRARFSRHTASDERTPLADRLRILSGAVQDVRKDFSQVSEKFNGIDYHNIASVYESAASAVCKTCDHRLTCWDTRYGETMDALGSLERVLRQNQNAVPETLPRYFREVCRKPDELCRAISAQYRVFAAQEREKRQTEKLQGFLLEHLDTLSETLSSLEKPLRASVHTEETARTAVLRAAQQCGEDVSSVEAIRLADGSLQIVLSLLDAEDERIAILSDAIEDECGVLFPPPAVFRCRGITRLIFCENAVFTAESSVRQTAGRGNHICGDSVECFTDALGQPCFLLSDGMGTGGRAAIDSLMTCSMLKKLICGGFAAQAAIRIVSSAVSVKSADESLSTVDLFAFDPVTGEASFLKAGAAPSLLFRGGQTRLIGSESLPIGIVSQPPLRVEKVRLAEDDVVLMFSDGALAFGIGGIRECLKSHAHRSAKEIAFAVSSALRGKEDACDDITVLAVKIGRLE